MGEPIIQSAAGFVARRSMVNYLERELELELQAAEQGVLLRTEQSPPVLGAYCLTLVLALWAGIREWRSQVRPHQVVVPRAFYGEQQ
jgi:hypothetical protein